MQRFTSSCASICLRFCDDMKSNEYFITINSANQNIGAINACGSGAPVVNFYYSAQGSTVPLTVTFNDRSLNAVSWLWDFGDGATSTQQNPVHVYTTAGDYVITLTVTGQGGATNTMSQNIHVGSANPGNDSTYINLSLNGINHMWLVPADSIMATHSDSTNTTFIQATDISKSIYFYILNDNASPGNYNINLSATLSGISYPNNAATTTITEYGMPGGYIVGTAAGQMKAQDSTSYRPFSMSYKVKRNQ